MRILESLDDELIRQLHQLYQNEWWTRGRALEDTRVCVENSQLSLALVNENRLAGFARVLSDCVYKALILDVIVAPAYRRYGLGDMLVRHILDHPKLQRVRHFELYCKPDMVEWYEKYGFSQDVGDVKFLRLTANLP